MAQEEQANVLVEDDPRYTRMFDVATEAAGRGKEVYGDLSPRMNALREQGAVHRGLGAELVGVEDHGETEVVRETYTFFSFETCERAFRDSETFSNEIYHDMEIVRTFGDTILWKTGDDHRRYRAVAQPLFTEAKVINWWKTSWGDEIVATLLDHIEKLDRTDLNFSLCARLPMQLVSQGFGLSGDQALEYRDNLLRAVDVLPATPEEKKQAFDRVNDTLRGLITARRAEPRNDVVSGIVHRQLKLEGGGSRPLTDEEVFAFCRLVMFAGGGTTWRQLGITLFALLTNDGFWEACRKDRALVPAAIEESIRWMPTDPFMPRLVTRDVEVAGVAIPAGARVDLCMGAANRDPARWDHPDAYDIFRPVQYNLGTALGQHRCLGHYVTRHEMAWAINGLLDRFPDLRLDPDEPAPTIVGGSHQRGISALPVLLR
ncbi:MAG TPA: cytochrome P450 [Novosphingobium sp.]|nr:cytochrome P450 [Novosphingobium sp.]